MISKQNNSKDTFYTSIRQQGNELCYIGYENGQRVQDKIAYEPTLFLADYSIKDSDWKSLDETPLKQFKCASINDARDFIQRYTGMSGTSVYGTDRFASQYIAENYPGDILYNVGLLRRFYIDIEVYSGNGFPGPMEASERVTAITLYDSKTKRCSVWHEPGFRPHGGRVEHNVPIDSYEFDDEASLLLSLIDFWSANYPDIVSGWYINGYDIPYLANRINKLLGEKQLCRLSPWGKYREIKSDFNKFGKEEASSTFEFYGWAELDYLRLYQKYVPHREESYKLDYIAFIQLGKKKLDYEGSLHNLYETDYQKYIDYNIRDVMLVVELDEKLKFIDLLVEVTYAGKVPQYIDSLGTVKYWEMLIYNHLYDKKIVCDIKKKDPNTKPEAYDGGFVKDPIVGMHEWVASFDLRSLYPSLIRQINIGSETRVPKDEVPMEFKKILANITPERLVNAEIDLSPITQTGKYSIAANGELYSKERQSFLSELMEKFFNRRVHYRSLMPEEKTTIKALEAEMKSRGLLK